MAKTANTTKTVSAAAAFKAITVPALVQAPLPKDDVKLPNLIEIAKMLVGAHGTLADVCFSYNGNQNSMHKVNAYFSGINGPIGTRNSEVRDMMGFREVAVTGNENNESRPGTVWTVNRMAFEVFMLGYNAWFDSIGCSLSGKKGQYATNQSVWAYKNHASAQ